MRLVRVAINVEQLLYQPSGGIGRYTAKLVTLLPRCFPGDEVVAFTARHSAALVDRAWQAAGGDPGSPPIRLPLPRPALYEAWNTLGMPALELMAKNLGHIEVVHAPSVAVPPRGSAPVVVTVHDVAPALFPEAFGRHGRWFHARGLAAAARRADLIITVSHAAAAEIQAQSAISDDRLRVVPNGVDHLVAAPEQVAAARARFGLSGSPYVLWVGTLEPRKDVATLVRAFAAVVDEGRAEGHRLALAGPSGWLSGGLVPEDVMARLGGADGPIRLLGHVGETDLRGLYRGATLLALPSRHEGFGLPVLEAMVQGTAVVCSDIAALREVSGGHARLVAPGDVDAWAAAMAGLIADGAARAGLAESGRAWAEGFSWERTVAATRAVYAEACNSAG